MDHSRKHELLALLCRILTLHVDPEYLVIILNFLLKETNRPDSQLKRAFPTLELSVCCRKKTLLVKSEVAACGDRIESLTDGGGVQMRNGGPGSVAGGGDLSRRSAVVLKYNVTPVGPCETSSVETGGVRVVDDLCLGANQNFGKQIKRVGAVVKRYIIFNAGLKPNPWLIP